MMYIQTAEKLNHGDAEHQKIRRYENDANILIFPVPAQKSQQCENIDAIPVRIMPDVSVQQHTDARTRLMRKRRSRAQVVMACFIIAALASLTIVFGGILLLGVSLSMKNAGNLFSVYAVIQALIWGILLVRS